MMNKIVYCSPVFPIIYRQSETEGDWQLVVLRNRFSEEVLSTYELK